MLGLTILGLGWATSSDSVAQDSAPNDANNFSWPGISDLGLSDLKINASDDDLGMCKSS